MAPGPPTARREQGRQPHPAVLLGLCALYVLLAAVSWGRSGDVLIDWGRELYTAWQLSQGAVLYRDVASMFGPLAAYLNALLFVTFGPSAAVLQAANIVGIGLLSILLYDVFRRISGHTGAAVATFVFLSVFAFAHMTEAGLFNFATPYSHAATLGLTLCVILVWMLMQIESRPGPWSGLGAGLACGLAWLTKPELGLAAVVTLLAGVVLLNRQSSPPGNRTWLAMAVGLLLPSAVAVVAFLGPLGFTGAVAVPFEAFRAAVASQAWDIPFYRALSGLARPWHNLAVVVGSAIGFLAFLASLEFLDRTLKGRVHQVVALILITAGAVSAVLLLDVLPWLEAARPLPVLITLVCAVVFARAWTARESTEEDGSLVGLACWSVLSLALLWKIALLARFYHFGFYLALPSTLLMAVVLVVLLPGELPASSGRLVRSFAILIVGASAANALGIEMRQYRARTFEVGPVGDRMGVFPPFIDPRAETVAATVDYLEERGDDFSSLLVLPEGVMLNYWLRTPTPTPHLSLMPPEVARHGEEAIWMALLRTPPDAIALTERRFTEYGANEFQDTPFGGSVGRWLRSDYCRLARFQARARDFEPEVLPDVRSVAHPSHYVEIYGRQGSRLCGSGNP